MQYRNGLFVLFTCICVFGASYAVNRLSQIGNVYLTARKNYELIQDQKRLFEYDTDEKKENAFSEAMKEINPDYIAWMTIKGTVIDYPVVQANHNYLNRDFWGEKSIYGCLSVSSAQVPFRDQNTVIFGHNMKDGSMFSVLKNYLEKEWFKQHDIIQIRYQGQTSFYKIFSVRILNEGDDSAYTYQFCKEDYKNFLSKSMEESRIQAEQIVDEEKNIITLSTCYGSDRRVIIQAQSYMEYEEGAIWNLD